jgi:hypothetical protein
VIDSPLRQPVLGPAILLGAAACAAVATWLFVVAATVVPERDPLRVGFWNGVGVGFSLYAVITAIYILRAGRWPVAPVAVLASIIAFVAGVSFALPMLLANGDFEGYIVLIGLVLVGQATLVLAHAALQVRRARFAP